jgi:hypothetical protein
LKLLPLSSEGENIMAQQPFTRKESPEKDARHAERVEPRSGELPPYESGELRPGQVGAAVFPSSLVTPEPQIGEAHGVPMIQLAPGPGTTLKYTISDVISHQQAEDAGQAPPKPDLPPVSVKKAKMLGIIQVSEEERQELLREEGEARRAAFLGGPAATPAGGRAPGGVVHPTRGHDQHDTESAFHGAAKSSNESATQAKYDNRGGGEK